MSRFNFLKNLSISSILFAGLLLSAFSFIFSACSKDDSNLKELEEQARQAYFKQLGIDTVIIKQYLTDNNITNAKSTKSGLFYYPINAGTGVKAQMGSRVTTHYVLKNLAGTVLQDSRQLGKTYTFTIGSQGSIYGYQEGVSLMKVGDRTQFILPSGIAYGPDGNGKDIAPNTILMFDIELLGVE